MRTPIVPIVLAAVILAGGAQMAFGRAPVATNDTYSVANNTTLTVPAPGVLANDFDSNGHTLSVTPLTSQTFAFDGITFDQAFTPNLYQSLTAGTYSNAVVTHLPSSAATEVTGFPEATTGFQGLLSMGKLFLDENSATGTKALNLPSGNDGSARRSGFELGWASGVMLTNLAGDDFVVYEAGSSGTPEAFMVQVHNAVDDVWSSWVYITSQSFKLYVGNPSEGLHSTKFNLDAFGIPANGRVDAIRIVNMTNEDRMQTGGEGVVLADDNGATSSILPDPAGAATSYAASALDPDIAYVGILHTLGATIPAYAATSELGATVTVNTDGSFTYDPSSSSALQALGDGQTAVDTFYYLVTDGLSGHTKGLVSITVSGTVQTGPMLTITRSGNNVTIRWPTTAGFKLQYTLSLDGTPEWLDVSTTPTIEGDQSSVTVDASSGQQFFRLINPPDV